VENIIPVGLLPKCNALGMPIECDV